MRDREHPVVVIGAGPVGLAAAAHLLDRGLEPLVLEAGEGPGHHVAEWGHVRMFSPWWTNVDPVARRRLETHGWTPPPDDGYPTGQELLERYLQPLSTLPEIAPRVRYGARVTAVGKLGFDRQRSAGREEAPFVVSWRRGGADERIVAKAVIDASGSWATPNPLGAGGLPAAGEREAVDAILARIPDVLGRHRERLEERTVMVVGGGDSAFNVLADLAALSDAHPRTRIVWAVRRDQPTFGGGVADQLPERGALGARVRSLLELGKLRLITGFQAERVVREGARWRIEGSGERLSGVDTIIACTGFRPDHSLAGELRLSLDPATESPAALGPLIDPNLHSCGSVPPHGAEELAHPDLGYWIVGMKSYGRAPTFLLLTGYEQVRSVAAAVAGDLESARRVHLTLPETGVCRSGVAEGQEAEGSIETAVVVGR